MSATFSVKGSFDGKELVQGFKDVKKEVQGLESAGEDAKKSLDEMLQQKNSTTNYKRQLSQITAELNDLAVNYARLSEAEKQSEFGQAMSQRIDELTAKAQELKGVFDGVNQTLKGDIQLPEPDVHVWDGMAELIEAAASGFQTYAGALGMSEESTEALTRTIAKMATIQAGANTVVKIGKMLQQESNLIMAVTKVQTMAATAAINLKTAAEVKGKAATVAATIAQKALNAAANANPYVLLASALIAVGTAIYKFAKNSNEAEEAERKHKEALEKAAEAAQNWRDKVSRAIEGPLSQYKLLEAQYKSLKTTHDKKQWINDNKDAFEELGLSVNNLKSAEDAFVNNTGNVVQALIKRATAAAKQQQLTELAAKYMDAQLRAEQEYNNKQKKAGDKVYSSNHNALSGDEYVDRNGNWVYTEQGARKANATIKKAAYAEANNLMAQMTKLAEELAADMPTTKPIKTTTTTTTTSTSSTPQPTTETPEIIHPDSLKYWQKEVQYLQGELSKMDPNTQEFDELVTCLLVAQDEVQAIQDMMKAPEMKGAAKIDINTEGAVSKLELFEERYRQTMDTMDAYSSVFSSIGSMMSSLGEGANETTKQWLNFGANAMNTVAQVLPQIASLIMANQAQALAGGTASAASLPFPANLAAIASVVASIIALFASFPKFASGGIVSGASKIGDFNLARVNGGELILNNRQQANLFNMLDKNRLPQSSISSGEVTFRIQGDTLVGVIDNYNRKRSRI